MLTVKAAAKKYEYSEMYLRKLARAGKIKATRNESGHWLLDGESIAARKSRTGGSNKVEFIEATDGEWCSSSEAVAITGLSPVYVNRRNKDGDWTARKDENGNWMIKLDEVRSYERTASVRDGYVYRVWLSPEEADELREQGYDVNRLNP